MSLAFAWANSSSLSGENFLLIFFETWMGTISLTVTSSCEFSQIPKYDGFLPDDISTYLYNFLWNV